MRIPVIASGGFASANGLVAALALGAEGINMGTRFMCTQEAPVHDRVKQAIVSNTEFDTALILRSLKNTSRVARTPLSELVLEMEREGATIEQIGPVIAGAKGRRVYEEGDVDSGIWTVGMVQALIDDIPTCEALVTRIMAQAEALISNRLAGLLGRHALMA